MKKVTKAQFNYWCRRVNYWLKEFGLADWTVFYMHQDLEDAGAQIRYTYSERSVTFALAWYLSEGASRGILNEIALHEVIHLVLAHLDVLAKCRYVELREIQDAAEGTTCRLTTFLKNHLTKQNFSKQQRSLG